MEKAPAKTNSSVPDLVFHQLKMGKQERVIGFMEKDSEEHFGKLVRKGGEILLPGVFPHKARLQEDLSKVPDGQNRKSKVQMMVDIPNSDTELETLLFYDGSSGELHCLGMENADRMRKSTNITAKKKASGSNGSHFSKNENGKENDESVRADTSEVILQTEQLIDVKEVNDEDSKTKILEETNKKDN